MISKQRLENNFDLISQISGEGEGITRIAFSDEDWGARRFILKLMEEAKLTIRFDHFGNIIGRREGTNPDAPVVMCGSHIDSVPNGGNYDGVVGVLAAIEVINTMNETNFQNYHPIEIVIFMCEESSRFGVATLGSKAMCGKLDVTTLKNLKDDKGDSLYSILKLHGLDADKIAEAKYTNPVKTFLELHIEQGKVLEATKKQIGIVTGIAAPTRLKVKIHGKADHSGATPMHLRNDALCGAAEIILKVEKFANKADKAVVGTVGIAKVLPGVMNVIPGQVEIGIDIRSIYLEEKIKTVKKILKKIDLIGEERGLQMDVTTLTNENPVTLNEDVINQLTSICQDKNYPHMQMPSGAGHDAMHWAHFAPTGMIFIPCVEGISHNPEEYASIEDIVTGTDVLFEAMCKFSSK